MQLITCGIPRGSPLVFLLYVTDLPTSFQVLDILMFADDTNLFYKHKNMSILFFKVNYELIMNSCKLWYSQGKSTLKWNSNTFEKYEYGHLGGWYIKSTLYTRLLNWSKIFEKINYSCWQNSVLCDRCILYSPFHMLWHWLLTEQFCMEMLRFHF